MTFSRPSPLGGRRPRRDELAEFVDGTLDDVIGDDVRLLIVGINPGLWTAAVNAPFAHPGNRFWPSLAESGLMPYRVDASCGLSDDDVAAVTGRGIGITNLVDRATARADQLSVDELKAGHRWIAPGERITPNGDRALLTIQFIHPAEIISGELVCEVDGTTDDVRWVPLGELDEYARADGWPTAAIERALRYGGDGSASPGGR